jgi:hypothetical protein
MCTQAVAQQLMLVWGLLLSLLQQTSPRLPLDSVQQRIWSYAVVSLWCLVCVLLSCWFY